MKPGSHFFKGYAPRISLLTETLANPATANPKGRDFSGGKIYEKKFDGNRFYS
jgi:hypothetical protein